MPVVEDEGEMNFWSIECLRASSSLWLPVNGVSCLFSVIFGGCIWGYYKFWALFKPARIKGFDCFEGLEYGLVCDGGASLCCQ